jgi:integrase
MARKRGEGTIEWVRGKPYARVSLPDGTRPRFQLTATDPAELERQARAVAKRARERFPSQDRHTTVKDFGELWTSDQLFKLHGEVRGLRPKVSAEDDEYRLKAYVYPEIGTKHVAKVTEIDIEMMLAAAPGRFLERTGRTMRAATRFQIYQVTKRLFDLAIKPGRLRIDNPVSPDLKPRKDAPRLFGWLYPDEVIRLMGCTEVPLSRRVLYALAVYTGLRRGSIAALRWSGADLAHRTLTSLESKTGLPQLFEIRADLVDVLSRWHEAAGGPAPAEPIVTLPSDRTAEVLRDDLRLAGVDRGVLFGGDPKVQPLRFHDLRATFITWARREGRGWGWISDRSGHVTPSQMERYNRAARTLTDLQIVPFPTLEGVIPELRDAPSNLVRLNA